MAKTARNVVLGSMAVAGLVALAAVIDMVTGYPFAGRFLMDVMFLIGAALVAYMGWESYQEMR